MHLSLNVKKEILERNCEFNIAIKDYCPNVTRELDAKQAQWVGGIFSMELGTTNLFECKAGFYWNMSGPSVGYENITCVENSTAHGLWIFEGHNVSHFADNFPICNRTLSFWTFSVNFSFQIAFKLTICNRKAIASID